LNEARVEDRTRHHPTAVDIRFQGPESAEVITLVIAITDLASPDHWGYWRDQFVWQADGRWLYRRPVHRRRRRAPDGWLAAAQQ
jgi:hypothetical protein